MFILLITAKDDNANVYDQEKIHAYIIIVDDKIIIVENEYNLFLKTWLLAFGSSNRLDY